MNCVTMLYDVCMMTQGALCDPLSPTAEGLNPSVFLHVSVQTDCENPSRLGSPAVWTH